MTTILLARHGETEWNRERLWQGHADMPLNDRGYEQARVLAATLADVDLAAIYASDLRRAHETALVVAEGRGLPVTTMPQLREVDTGSWTGLSRAVIRERFPTDYASFKARTGRGWEGGESYDELRTRILAALAAIARAHAADDRLLVVTHAGAIRVAKAHALGRDYARDRKAASQVTRTGLAAVVVEDDVFRPLDVDEYLAAAGRAYR